MRKLAFLLAALCLAGIMTGCTSYRETVLAQAVSGNAWYEGLLAEYYLNGYMFEVDYKLAEKYAVESAKAGDPAGKYVLGIICEYGLGQAQVNKAKAKRLYKEAFDGIQELALRSTKEAQYLLGSMYLYGRGVENDPVRAALLLKMSSDKNFVPAQAIYGQMLVQGKGVKKDVSRGREMLYKASHAGSNFARTSLADTYYSQKKYTAAYNWYKIAGKWNSPEALTRRAQMCRDGVGRDVDESLARELFTLAAAMNYPPALTELSELKITQKLSEKEGQETEKMLRTALRKGYVPACKTLGDYYRTRTQHRPEYNLRAMELYQLAMNNGISSVQKDFDELDKNTGLYIFIHYAWKGVTEPAAFLTRESSIYRVINGFRAGMIEGSRQVFYEEMKNSPQKLYRGNDWYLIFAYKMQPEWAAEIFKVMARSTKPRPLYWLSYGTSCNLAGRPELAMTAVKRINLLGFSPLNLTRSERQFLKDIAIVLRTSALVQRGLAQNAYNQLFSEGKLTSDQAQMANFINHFALPVLKDKKKFSVASGISLKLLGKFKKLPAPAPFYDYQEKVITPPTPEVPEPNIIR